jgi:hypothetical protein
MGLPFETIQRSTTMVNHNFTISGLAAAAVAAGLFAVAAQGAEPGAWYVGGSSDSTDVVVYGGLGSGTGGRESGLSVRGGLQLSRRFGVEFQALQAANLGWSEYLANIPYGLNAHTTFDVSALQAAAVGNWSWGPVFEGYLKAGLAWYDLDGRQVVDTLAQNAAATRAVSGHGSDLLFGLGLKMKATPQWAVRLDYQHFGLDREFLGTHPNDDPELDTFSVGVDYRFGKGARGSVNRSSNDKDSGL